VMAPGVASAVAPRTPQATNTTLATLALIGRYSFQVFTIEPIIDFMSSR
jgi:hypothetical protein